MDVNGSLNSIQNLWIIICVFASNPYIRWTIITNSESNQCLRFHNRRLFTNLHKQMAFKVVFLAKQLQYCRFTSNIGRNKWVLLKSFISWSKQYFSSSQYICFKIYRKDLFYALYIVLQQWERKTCKSPVKRQKGITSSE